MTQITMRELVSRLCEWAPSSHEVSKLIIVGSRAKHCESDEPIGKSDVDIVIFLSPGCDGAEALQELAKIGVSSGALIHPLFIRHEDCKMKCAISEYKLMLSTGKEIYGAEKETQQKH